MVKFNSLKRIFRRDQPNPAGVMLPTAQQMRCILREQVAKPASFRAKVANELVLVITVSIHVYYIRCCMWVYCSRHKFKALVCIVLMVKCGAKTMVY